MYSGGMIFNLDAHVQQGYSTQFVCVCVCVSVCLYVTALTATYMHVFFKSKVRYRRVLHGVLNICNMWLSLKMLCYGVIYLPPLLSTLPDELSTDVRNSSGFFSRRRVRTFNDGFSKTTDSSLFSAKELLSFLAYFCARG